MLYEMSFLFYVITFFIVLKARCHLFTFLFIIYTLQFLSLFFSINEVKFWARGDYWFAKDHPLPIYMLSVLNFTNIGFILAGVIWTPKAKLYPDFGSMSGKYPSFIDSILIVLLVVLVSIHLLLGSISGFNGLDLLIITLLAFCGIASVSSKSKLNILIIIFITCIYIYSQISSSDRNFISIFISISIFYLTFFKVNVFKFLQVIFFVSLVFLLGVYIVIVRSELDLTLETGLEFAYFNSWVAVIRPVIDLVRAESFNIDYLYGKTYIDLLLSIIPTPFYSIFGLVRPFVEDNPAQWYYVTGGGGMHAVGVALKNFGFIGAVLQSFIFSIFTLKLTDIVRIRNNLFYYSFYLSISVTYMKSIWYSFLDFTNGITIFLILTIIVMIFRKVLPYKRRE